MDKAHSSCRICLCPLPDDVESGLCEACSGTPRTEDTRTSPPPAFDSNAPSKSAHASDLNDLLPVGDMSSTGSFPDPLDEASTADAPSGASARMPPHPPGYELVGEISHGGMGVVYLADEPGASRRVAIKYLLDSTSRSSVERFKREAKLASLQGLRSPHVVKVLTSNMKAADPYYVMELAGGGPLSKRVTASKPLDPEWAARWMRDIAGALQEAHDNIVIHRDIKPGNILLARKDGRDAAFVRTRLERKRDGDAAPFDPNEYLAKLSDFGLAKRLDATHGVTVGSIPLGTAPYMSPEQVNNPQGGEAEYRVGVLADVYSLGATLYDLVCGRPPFVGDTAMAVMQAVLRANPKLPRAVKPDLPEDLEAIIVKAMARRPGSRYQTAKEMADDLDRFLNNLRPKAPRLTRARRAWRAVCRRQKAIAAVALVACVFVAGVIAASRPPDLPPPNPRKQLEDALVAAAKKGSPVRIVGQTGMPLYSDWLMGASRLAPSEAWNDGTPGFQTGTETLLTFAHDPMTDHYRFEAELCHEQKNREHSTFGLFVGYERHVGVGGEVAHFYSHAAYSEFWDDIVPRVRDPKLNKWHGLGPRDFVWALRRPGNFPDTRELGGLGFEPFLPESRSGVWRRIAAEVTPNSLSWSWYTPEGTWVELTRPGEPSMADRRARLDRALATSLPGSGIQVGNWNPRQPLGLVAVNATVSFRNVTLTPRIPKGE